MLECVLHLFGDGIVPGFGNVDERCIETEDEA